MERILNTLRRSTTFSLYECHDGVMVNGGMVTTGLFINGQETSFSFQTLQRKIFNTLPNTNVQSFSYTSMYMIPDFSCFTGVPRSLKIIELANWRGVPDIVIEQLMAQGVECHSQYDIPFANSNLTIYSDSGNYKLYDGYWTRHESMVGEEVEMKNGDTAIILRETRSNFLVEIKGQEKYIPKDSIRKKRTPEGYLYMVKDKDWKNKFKVGFTKQVDDVKKNLIGRYQTSFGIGNVVVVKVVPIFGDVRRAERVMLSRFRVRKGEVVSGSESFVKSKVF